MISLNISSQTTEQLNFNENSIFNAVKCVLLYFLYSQRVRDEEKERKKQRDMAANEEGRQIERENERMKAVQDAGGESSGFQESCKQC